MSVIHLFIIQVNENMFLLSITVLDRDVCVLRHIKMDTLSRKQGGQNA